MGKVCPILGLGAVALLVWLAPFPSSAQSTTIIGYARIIDGETIDYRINGQEFGVRLIGVDAPQGNTRCGIAARGMLWHYARGGVQVQDVPGLTVDQKGRKLQQVLTRDGTKIANELVKMGEVDARDEGPDRDELKADEDDARNNKRGCLWSEKHDSVVPPDSVTLLSRVSEPMTIVPLLPGPLWRPDAQVSSCPNGQFLAQYFNNETLSGAAAFTGCEAAPISYDWSGVGPGHGLGASQYSVRWTGNFDFTAGSSTFTTTADDGVRIWLDGTLLVDAWVLEAPTTYQATQTVSAGTHQVKMEYFQDFGGAVAQLNWATRVPPTSPSGFTYDVVAGVLNAATAHAFLPDGRILIALQDGRVLVYKNGQLLPTPLIDLRNFPVNNYWDNGLRGIAADPNFATNGYIYLFYTYENDPTQYNSAKTGQLARYTVVGDTASPGTQVVLLGKTVGTTCENFPVGADCLPDDWPSHGMGTLKFAADGSLFVSTGEGAGWGNVDPLSLRSQSLDSLGGKLLRITSLGAGLPSNPFYTGNVNANRAKVWAYGLRNPFRMTLRPGSGVPYLGDVGWNDWEEINVGVAGGNYGWPCYEGTGQQPGYAPYPVCQTLYSNGTGAVRMPLTTYNHNGVGAAVAGGDFYTGTNYPAQYQGAYFYGDYVLSVIRSLTVDSNNQLVGTPTDVLTNADAPVDFKMSPDGYLYYISYSTGELRRLRTSSSGRCATSQYQAEYYNNQTLSGTPTFSQCEAAPISYNWGTVGPGNGIGAANYSVRWSGRHTFTSANYTFTATASDGVRVWVDGSPIIDAWRDQGATTYTATRNITAGDHDVRMEYYKNTGSATARLSWQAGAGQPPTATISAPSPSLLYKVGDTISYAGSGNDPETGAIGPSGLAWQLIIHHCPGGVCHTHPFLTSTGPTGSFVVPDHGDNSYFELFLTATDPTGLTGTTSIAIQPQPVQITLDTVPSGLQVVYDGTAGTAPLSRTTIVNSVHTIYAPSPQGNQTFASWSDGGAQQHNITMSGANTTFRATFTQAGTSTVTPTRTATPTGPSITASPGTVAPGGTETVTWSGVTSPTTTDWVGLYVPGAADTAWTPGAWFYTNSCSQTAGATPSAAGTCMLTIPATLAAGTYEVRLYAQGGFTRLATSPTFTVMAGSGTATPTGTATATPAGTPNTTATRTSTVTPTRTATPTGPSITASPGTVAPGGTETVTWSGVTSPTTTDWVGLYVPGAADTAWTPGAWFYTNSCSQTAGATPSAAGTCMLTIPATLAAGTYEVRLYAQGGFTRLATSPTFTVMAGSGTATPTGTATATPAGTPNTTATRTSTVTPTRTATPTGPSITASPGTVAPGGTETVTWSGVTSPTTTDWVGLYVPGAADTAWTPGAWFYTNSCSQTAGATPSAAGTCMLTIPATLAAGSYEVRLYAQGGYTRLATSPTFTVMAGSGTATPTGTATATTTCAQGQYLAQYYANITLSGSPAVTRCEPQAAAPNSINYATSGTWPPTGIPATGFSVRWTGSFSFASTATYTFTTTADDGIRLWLDGATTPLIDNWVDQAPTTKQATQALSSGVHQVKVEYYNNCCGGSAQVSWR